MVPTQFNEAAVLYIERLEQENGKNLANKKRQLKQGLIPFFQEMLLTDIGREEVERFKHYLLQEGLKHSTVNRYLATLSNLFNRAVEWGWLGKRPCKIAVYPENSRMMNYLTLEEIERLLAAARRDQCRDLEVFIHIALGTALRRMEILSLEIQHIDCANREIFIPESQPNSRIQPMVGSLATYLKDYIDSQTTSEQQYLFPAARSQTGHRVEIERPFYRVLEAAELDRSKVSRHTLRQTAIMYLIQTGADMHLVQRFAGRRVGNMNDPVFKKRMSKALDKLDKRLGN